MWQHDHDEDAALGIHVIEATIMPIAHCAINLVIAIMPPIRDIHELINGMTLYQNRHAGLVEPPLFAADVSRLRRPSPACRHRHQYVGRLVRAWR